MDICITIILKPLNPKALNFSSVQDQASTRDTWDAMDADAEPPAGLVVKKKKRKMKKKGGRKSKRIVAKTPAKKNDDEAASAGQDEPEDSSPKPVIRKTINSY